MTESTVSKVKLTIVIEETFENEAAIVAALNALLPGASFVIDTTQAAADGEDILIGAGVSDGGIAYTHGGYGDPETMNLADVVRITVF